VKRASPASILHKINRGDPCGVTMGFLQVKTTLPPASWVKLSPRVRQIRNYPGFLHGNSGSYYGGWCSHPALNPGLGTPKSPINMTSSALYRYCG